MATPTTLVEYATQELDAHSTARAAAQAALVSAQAALAAAREDHATAVEEFAEIEADIAARKALLAATDVPTAAVVLLEEIAELVIDQRRKQGEVLDAADGIADAQAKVDAATAAMGYSQTGEAAATATLAAAVAEAALRDGWKTTAAASTVAADALAALSAQPFTAAETAYEGDLHADLRAAVESRYAARLARIDRAAESYGAAETLLAAAYEADGGLDGLVDRRRLEFELAEDALRSWVDTARQRYDRAIALLGSVGDDVLSDDESVELDDATLLSDRQAAATAGNERDTAATAEDDARRDWEDATLEAQAADPGADVTGVTAVSDALAAHEGALTGLGTEQGDYDAVRDDYDGWTVLVPDRAWRKVYAFVEGRALLTDLSDDTPGTLVTALETAEQAYAEALYDASRRERGLEILEEGVAYRSARLAALQAARQSRLFSAVRGDS